VPADSERDQSFLVLVDINLTLTLKCSRFAMILIIAQLEVARRWAFREETEDRVSAAIPGRHNPGEQKFKLPGLLFW